MTWNCREQRVKRITGLGIAGFALGITILCCALWASESSAQSIPARPAPSNRYLFIVETSHSMQRRENGIFKAVQNLLLSGMGGQLRRGDTLGLWTFNSALHAGQFPLQQWSQDDMRGIGLRMVTYLHEQKFEKSSRLDRVFPLLDRVVASSDFITVILITSGSENIKGTGFDDKINHLYKTWRDEQDKAAMPIVTVLRGKNGKLTDFAVSPAQWPLDLPPLPAELIAAATKPPKAAPPPPAKAETPALRPPIIITSKKTEPTQPAAATNSTAPQAAPQVKEASDPSPPMTLSVPPPAAEPVGMLPGPSPQADISFGTTTAVPAKPPSPAVPAVSESRIGITPPIPKLVEASTAIQPTAAAVTASVPTESRSAEANISLQSVLPASNARPIDSNLRTESPRAELAVATPGANSILRPGVILIGLVLFIAGIVLVYCLLRQKARVSGQASLITRSMDQHSK